MLVLTRHEEESIDFTIDISSYINIDKGQGDIPITIKVLDIKGSQVRLGIEAPDSVLINRSELVIDI